jgi:hypothetical protein
MKHEPMPRRLSRLEVRAFYCPECGAQPGEPCKGARGKVRQANHQSRWNEADQVRQPESPLMRSGR